MAATARTVTDQVPPLVGHDVFASDRALSAAVERHVPRRGPSRRRPPIGSR
ncbi:hypothetical protein [Streptomyces sp. NPDC017524]|uniref:hypothetical protein n=1 Tax=unclassified Streptomyces TaxID=2593676 RepID=UPI0037AF14E2